MKSDFLVVADYVQDIGGKLVIVGTFDTFHSEKAPFAVRNIGIALKLRSEPNEQNAKHDFEVRIRGENSDVIARVEGDLTLHSTPTDRHTAQLAINMANIQVPRFGRYTVELWVDRRLEKAMPIYVNPITPPPVGTPGS